MTCIPLLKSSSSRSQPPQVLPSDRRTRRKRPGRDPPPVWDVKETVCKEDRKESEETNAPKRIPGDQTLPCQTPWLGR